jgi:hypothetical protein
MYVRYGHKILNCYQQRKQFYHEDIIFNETIKSKTLDDKIIGINCFEEILSISDFYRFTISNYQLIINKQ